MEKLNRPAEFGDNVISWVFLLGIILVLMFQIFSLVKQHINIHDHLVTERKILQKEITKLRDELEAHDKKPYVFERKVND